MTTLLRAATALGLGLGLLVLNAPAADAQSTQALQFTQSTEGGHIATRARGGRGVYVAPRYYGPSRGYNRGRYIAGGVAAGIAGAIILNEVARSSRPNYYYSEGGLTCGQLEARCDSGQDWACRRLDRDPNC